MDSEGPIVPVEIYAIVVLRNSPALEQCGSKIMKVLLVLSMFMRYSHQDCSFSYHELLYSVHFMIGISQNAIL